MREEKTFICDGCGETCEGESHADHDEQFNVQEGIELCTACRFGDEQENNNQ